MSIRAEPDEARPKALIITPEGVMMELWYDAAEEAPGWRLAGVDHVQVVVSRMDSWALGISLPEAVVDPPNMILQRERLFPSS